MRAIQEMLDDEIHNLAAQTHVQVSFETPEYTAKSDALGALRLLAAMRREGFDVREPREWPRARGRAPRATPGELQYAPRLLSTAGTVCNSSLMSQLRLHPVTYM